MHKQRDRTTNSPAEEPTTSVIHLMYLLPFPQLSLLTNQLTKTKDPTPPGYYSKYLERDDIMNALGVKINYTQSNQEIYYAFQQTGDFVWPNFLSDLEHLLSLPIRVSLIYGDADYICNWFGGEAVSEAIEYPHAKQFRKAGYVPMVVDGVEYGESREYGNFSFTRVYQAGHEVPYYQPVASLQLFNRTINGWDVARGEVSLSDNPQYGTEGKPEATHTESFVPLPSMTASSSSVGPSSSSRPSSSSVMWY